jgi:16S rRNA (guanine1207-N2)-methyltransferase
LRDREAGAAEVVAGVLPELGVSGPIWVAGDASGRIETAVEECASVLSWKRTGADGAPWPGPERADAAIVRLPKGREAFEMALHAIASRLSPGAPLLVVGANDEGIRSADKRLAEVAENPRTLDARRHCRVWRGEVRHDVEFRGELDDWAETAHGQFPDGEDSWISFPGLFAHGHLDPATSLLLSALTGIEAGSRVLDFGCGVGVIGRNLASLGRDLELHALDNDALALEATCRNVPDVTLHASDGLTSLPTEPRFDRIVSNPPIHTGKDQHYEIVRSLCREAPQRLVAGGELWVVAQRTVPIGRMLGGFAAAEEVASTASFTVWRARTATERS